MSKLLLIDLGPGNLSEGFPTVTVQFWKSREKMFTQYKGHLPAQPNLLQLYREWKLLYNALHQRLDWGSRMQVVGANVTNVSQASFDELCLQLQDVFNDWLNTEMFAKVSQSLANELSDDDEVQVIIETEDQLLRRMPWHQWEFFDRYQHAELALSAPQWEDTYPSKSPPGMVRILAVFGNAKGIDFDQERQVLEALPGANVFFLKEPSPEELAKYLEDAQGWSILFFAGHSRSEKETGWIQLNCEQTISIDYIEQSIAKAIQNGLQIAIFNSCDGLGIAQQIESLNIPHIIVMRERVVDLAAQTFLNRFLLLFSSEVSFFVAVKQARQSLRALEDTYPCASWLPVICQNPSAGLPTWKDLRFKRTDLGICPYKGLEFFDCNDEDPKYFFGREALVSRLVEHVCCSNFLALVGASGNGKSSVLRAGLLHQLKLGQLIEGSDQWRIYITRPDREPMNNLAMLFVDEGLCEIDRALELGEVQRCLIEGTLGLNRLIQVAPESRVILVIDQFEEVFTRCEDSDEREHYLALLMEALAGSGEKLCLIIAIRSDFLGKFVENEYSGLAQLVSEQMIPVLPMKYSELKSAITKPAEQVGLDIEGVLVTEIINDIQAAPGSLPLLQYSLKELWQERQDNQLKLSEYQLLGGIQGTLDKRATAIYESFNEAEKLTVRHIFQQLTQLGEGTEDTRRRVLQTDLASKPMHPAERVQSVIAKLSSKEHRLLVISDVTGKTSRSQTGVIVDVAHEALIRHWKLLRNWLENNRDLLRLQRRIETSAISWREQCQQPEYLLKGRQLLEAKEFCIRQSDAFPLSNSAKKFIARSLRQRREYRIRIAVFLIIPAITIIGIMEFNLREAAIKANYASLDQQGTYEEKIAVEALVKGCTGNNGELWLFSYFYERILGNCRSLIQAPLEEANLNSASLIGANLNSASLIGANLNSTNLFFANLNSANLNSASLIGANLDSTNLNSANLNSANLNSASLIFANLSAASLIGANLISANLNSANFISANLSAANLNSADLRSVIFLATDLRRTKGLTQIQFESRDSPLLCNTLLPNNIEINPERDCDKLPNILIKRYPKAFRTIEKSTEYVYELRQQILK